MGKVILDMSMSLDGYISGKDDDDAGLHNWYFAPADDDVTGHNATVNAETVGTLGAIVMGRRSYEVGARQDGFADSPYDVANIVVSHDLPAQRAKGAEGFIFVTDGIESALEQAKAAAGDKDIAIGGGASIAQQYLKAGLIDEIQIHLIPVLLGEGIRLFDPLGMVQIELESTRVLAGTGVTHLQYRVMR